MNTAHALCLTCLLFLYLLFFGWIRGILDPTGGSGAGLHTGVHAGWTEHRWAVADDPTR